MLMLSIANDIFSYIWNGILITFVFMLLVYALCYHHIFKPDYRPGHQNMPFFWFQAVSSVFKFSRKTPLLTSLYNSAAMNGLVKLNEHLKICSFSLPKMNYVLLFTPEHVEAVLSSTKITDKSADYSKIKYLFMDGLFTSNGEKNKYRRKILTPAFHFGILKDFALILRETTKIVVSKIEMTLDEPYVNVDLMMKRVGCALLMKSAVGIDTEIDDEPGKELFRAFHRAMISFNSRLGKPWLYFDFIYDLTEEGRKAKILRDYIHNYFRTIIKEKKNKALASLNQINQRKNYGSYTNGTDNGIASNRNSNGVVSNGMNDDIVSNGISNGAESNGNSNKNGKKQKAFMDLLLDLHLKGSLTEEDILEETLNFFAGGIISTGHTLGSVLYYIGLYKDVQKRLHDEIDEKFGNSDREITESDLKTWIYLECVIKEVMRLHGIEYFSRTATENFDLGDYTIPRGSTVVIFTGALHKNPAVWPDSLKFDPTRFYPDNSFNRHPFAFVPFSAGIRSCIGQKFAMLEMKTVVAAILRKFSIHSLDPLDKLYQCNSDTTEANAPVRVRFSIRNKK